MNLLRNLLFAAPILMALTLTSVAARSATYINGAFDLGVRDALAMGETFAPSPATIVTAKLAG